MPSDCELFEKIRGGDDAALDELLTRYESTILRYGIKICGDKESARDVLQETMLQVAQSAESFREDADFTSWLWTVAKRRCFRLRRRKAGEPVTIHDLQELDVIDPGADPETAQLGRQLLRALQTLGAEDQEIVLLRDLQGLTTPEAATALNIGESAVKSRLHRARARLRDALAPPKEILT